MHNPVITIIKMKFLIKNLALPPVMARVAIFSVAVSILVMNIAICVVEGFTHEVDAKVKGILSSYQIVRYDNNFSADKGFVIRDTTLERKIRESGYTIFPYATKAGIAKNSGEISGIELKGVEDEERLNFYKKYLVSGELPSISGEKRLREVIISVSLAKHLKVKSGDMLETLFFDDPPLREQFKVTGIYDTAIGTLDKILMITDLRNVQYIYEWENSKIAGYDVMGGDYDDLCGIVDSYSGVSLMVNNIRDQYPQIYSWLELQSSNELVIITIMLVVGVINIVAMMLILLLQNIYQIGVLTILGMRQRDIRKIFIRRSFRIVLKALLIGNVVSLVLLLVQQQFHLVKLDSVGYSVDSVPVFFAWWKLLAVNVGVIIVILFFQWLTTFVISKVRPSQIVKYEKR